MDYSMPNQRASASVKRTKDWYIPMTEYVIKLATASSDKRHTKKCLNAANCLIDADDYKYVLKTYMSAEEQTELERDLDISKIGTLRNVDILTPIKDKYMGEFINSFHNYMVYSFDPEIIIKRNDRLGKLVTKKMFDKLQQLLSSSDGQSDIDIAGFIKTELENWSDETVDREQKCLELLNSEIEARRKYVDAYFYWWACEEVYTYRRLSGSNVDFEVVNPLEYYRVNSGQYFAEDDDAGMRRYTMTIPQIIDHFYNNMEDGLSDEQVNLLRKLVTNSNSDGATYITNDIYTEFKHMFDKKLNFTGQLTFTTKNLATTIEHCVYKTEIKRGILKYIGSDAMEHEMDVDEDYELDTLHGDISIEWKYINQAWESWRFGSDSLRLYIPARPIDLQRELVSNISVCKLPYNGISYIHASSEKKPIAYRIKDNIALYTIYTLLEERWLNKFKSWLLLPESTLSDSVEMTTPERLQQADVDALFPFNDAYLKENPQALSAFKEIATTAVVEYVKILNQIKNEIKNSAWELANMNDARFGQTNPYKTKGGTEYDLNQAIKGTVWSLEMFNSFREKDYMANLDYSRAAWIDRDGGSYVDHNTGEIVTVNIAGEERLGTNIGIFIANSSKLNSQAEALKQIGFAASQNDAPDIAAEIVTNENIGKLKMLIKDATKAKQELSVRLQTAGKEIEKQIEETKLADNREQRVHDMEVVDKTLANNKEIAVFEAEVKFAIEEARLEVDTNGNGYIDSTEADNTLPGVTLAKERAVNALNEKKNNLALLKMGQANVAAKARANQSKNKSK